MAGWNIMVSQRTPEELDSAPGVHREGLLAHWEAGIGGIEWLEQLVDAGQARRLSDDGFPRRYVAAARHVLPLLASGTPPFYGVKRLSGDWLRNVEVFGSRVAACAPDYALTIDAWDRS